MNSAIDPRYSHAYFHCVPATCNCPRATATRPPCTCPHTHTLVGRWHVEGQPIHLHFLFRDEDVLAVQTALADGRLP